MFVVFAMIHYKGISKQFALFKSFKFERSNSRLILIQSSPLIFQHAISLVSLEFFYILIEHHGAKDLAISNTMRNIFGFFGPFVWAFAATTNTMVSNIIGQGMHQRVEELIKKIVRLSTTIAVAVGILMN